MAAAGRVQRAGRIRAHELDQHPLALGRRHDAGAEPVALLAQALERVPEPRVGQEQVEEARPRDLGALELHAQAGSEPRPHLLGDLARRRLQRRRQQHRDVRREVAELRPRRPLERRRRRIGAAPRIARRPPPPPPAAARRDRPAPARSRPARVVTRRRRTSPRPRLRPHRARFSRRALGRHERQARHRAAARLVGRHDLVRPGPDQLALRGLDRRPGDDRDVRAQLPRGQRREDVLGVGVDACDHGACALDAGLQHRLVVGPAPLDQQHVFLLGVLAHIGVVVDHHERHPACAQVLRDLPADAAVPADQVVVLELGDLALHAALVEQSREVPGDEQLRQGDEDEEHRTHAEDRQEDVGDVAAERLRVRDRPDRRHRVQRPRGAAPVGDVLERGQAAPPASTSSGDRADQQRDPAQEEQHLVARRRAAGSQPDARLEALGDSGGRHSPPRGPWAQGSVMVRLARQDLVRAKELLQQDHPRELVRKRQRARTTAAVGPLQHGLRPARTGPPPRRRGRRATCAAPRSARPAPRSAAPSPAVQGAQTGPRRALAAGSPVVPLRQLDLLQPRMARQQAGVVVHVVRERRPGLPDGDHHQPHGAILVGR